ncbi:MAG: FAD:protein FMN transferase [Candidatus Dormibacterales bacterium]
MPRNRAVQARRFDALGTTCALFTVGRSSDTLMAGERWVRRLGARLTRFTSDSELSRLNSSAGCWADISADLESVLRVSLRAFELSGGRVNAAVLPSMLAIGYTRPLAHGPAVALLDRAAPLPPLPEVLSLRPGAARLEVGTGLDLGGVAKGWMADLLIDRLGPNSVANLGGDLRAAGSGPQGDGWPIGVGGRILLLRDCGAATSSVRRRRWGVVHHLIDPRTGRPAQSGLEEVSVVAVDAFHAEVHAKTALLLGPDLAPAYCAANASAWWLSR